MADEDQRDWDEQHTVTGRPPDEPPANSTFAERASARQPKKKAVQADDAENKAMSSSRSSRKSSNK